MNGKIMSRVKSQSPNSGKCRGVILRLVRGEAHQENTVTYTAIIADNNPDSRQKTELILTENFPEISIVAVAEDGLTARDQLDYYKPDLGFFEVELPEMNGIDAATKSSFCAFINSVCKYFLWIPKSILFNDCKNLSILSSL
jgi:hypothetical protein